MSEAGAASRPDHPNLRSSPWLARQLRFPPVLGGFAVLRAQWRCCEITVDCDRPPELRPGAWMVYALRGAVGDVLFERELPGPERASAWQALYSARHLQIANRQVPVPLLLDVAVFQDAITVTARLFGFADAWRDVFIGALISALNRGVSVWENSSARKPWRVHDFHYVTHTGAPAPAPPGPDLRLRPLSPLCYGAQAHLTDQPERFVLSALGRVALLARWQRVLLDFTIPDLAAVRAACWVQKGIQGPMTTVRKHSRRHARHELALRGEATELLLRVPFPAWRDALVLASACGAGGHVAYGFGRFTVEQM